MRPASGLANAPGRIDLVESRVAIGLQRAREVAQVTLGMLALAIGRVREPHPRRRGVPGGPVIPNIRPQSPRFRSSQAGASTGTGVSSACNFAAPSRDAVAPPPTAPATGSRHPPSPPAWCAPVPRPPAHKSLPGGTTGDGRSISRPARAPASRVPPDPGRSGGGRFRLHNLVAVRAGQLRPHLLDHLEVGRNVLQDLGDIFAQSFQRAAAVRTGRFLRQNRPLLARQMTRQRPSRRLPARGRGCRRLRRRGSRRGLRLTRWPVRPVVTPIARSADPTSPTGARTASAAAWQSAVASVRSRLDAPPVVRPGSAGAQAGRFRLHGERLMLGADESL